MNKIVKITLLSFAALALYSCKIDNYEAPSAGIEGRIIDKVTGKNMEVSHGTGNFALRVLETSWANGDESILTTYQTLNIKQDGTYRNTKLFEGEYDIWPHESAVYENESTSKQHVVLKKGKVATLNFEVTPYFEIEWVGEPWQDEEGYVHARYKFTCNPVPEGHAPATPQKGQLFTSTTVKVGTNSDSRYAANEINVTSADEGNVLEVKTKNPIYFSQKLWLRVGVKANVNATNLLWDKYCLSSIKTIDAKGTKD